MWRGDPVLEEVKAENRKRIFIEKKSPLNYFDILSVVEHPAFEQFYNELMEEGEVLF
jgi:type III restriction enzyme